MQRPIPDDVRHFLAHRRNATIARRTEEAAQAEALGGRRSEHQRRASSRLRPSRTHAAFGEVEPWPR